MTSPITKAFKYYLDHQDEMVQKYDGKVIVLRDDAVHGAFDSYGEASDWARQHLGIGTYALQKVSEGPKDYTIYLRTPMPISQP